MMQERKPRLLGKRKPMILDEPVSPKMPTMKPKAEYSMFLHDFARWDDILKSMAESGAAARSGDGSLLRFYYESMWQFWIEIFEIIERYDYNEPEERKINPRIKKLFDRIRIHIEDYENSCSVGAFYGMGIPMPDELVVDLRTLHGFLLSTKLKLNLGVWTSTPLSEEQRMKKIL